MSKSMLLLSAVLLGTWHAQSKSGKIGSDEHIQRARTAAVMAMTCATRPSSHWTISPKMGGIPVEAIDEDDQQRPDVASRV